MCELLRTDGFQISEDLKSTLCNPKKVQTIDLVRKTNHQLTTMDYVINEKMKVCIGLTVMCL